MFTCATGSRAGWRAKLNGVGKIEISRVHQLISHKYLSSEDPLCLAGVAGGGGGVYKTWWRWWLVVGGGVDLALGAAVTDCRCRCRRTVTASGRWPPFHHWRIDFALANIYIYWVGLKK